MAALSGAMFLGNRVDDACTLYFQRQLAGDALDLDLEQLIDALPRQLEDAAGHGLRRASSPESDELGGGAGEDAGGGGSAPTCLCACQPPRRLRMAPTVYALAEVLCVR
jgi:hypothetical protein